ncbi:MAG: hypothetical protein RLZ44_204 [Pseudomonadota bacterium]
MGLPLIPFAAGLATGALTALGIRDTALQKQVKHGAQWLEAGAERLYGTVARGVSSVFGLRTVPEAPAEKAPTKAKRPRAKATGTKAAPAKRTRASKTAETAPKRRATRSRKAPAKEQVAA